MNATLMAKTAYARPDQPSRTERDIEYEIFARVTRALKQAGAGTDFADLARAIHDNRRLWAKLGADLALPQNGLPPDLRAKLTYLAGFTRQHSHRVLRREATPEILVEINTAVMRGLRHEGSAP